MAEDNSEQCPTNKSIWSVIRVKLVTYYWLKKNLNYLYSNPLHSATKGRLMTFITSDGGLMLFILHMTIHT